MERAELVGKKAEEGSSKCCKKTKHATFSEKQAFLNP